MKRKPRRSKNRQASEYTVMVTGSRKEMSVGIVRVDVVAREAIAEQPRARRSKARKQL